MQIAENRWLHQKHTVQTHFHHMGKSILFCFELVSFTLSHNPMEINILSVSFGMEIEKKKHFHSNSVRFVKVVEAQPIDNDKSQTHYAQVDSIIQSSPRSTCTLAHPII